MASFDLVSFIPGIGNTKTFSPGVNTPAAYAGPHTGMTDGTSVATASSNMAEVYNRILLDLTATVASSGLTPDPTNWAQLPIAVQMIATTQAQFVVGNAMAGILTLKSSNVFTQANLSGTSITLPSTGTWEGIWIALSNSSGSVFTAAGGTVITAGSSPFHLFAVRIA